MSCRLTVPVPFYTRVLPGLYNVGMPGKSLLPQYNEPAVKRNGEKDLSIEHGHHKLQSYISTPNKFPNLQGAVNTTLLSLQWWMQWYRHKYRVQEGMQTAGIFAHVVNCLSITQAS